MCVCVCVCVFACVRMYVVLVKSLSCVQLFCNPCILACQAPLSMGFLKQEYGSGLLLAYPGDLSDPGIKTVSSAFAGRFFITGLPQRSPCMFVQCHNFNWHIYIYIPLKSSLLKAISVNENVCVGGCAVAVVIAQTGI